MRMSVRWEIEGEEGHWKARAENEYTYAEASADDLFTTMEKAEEELVKKTEEILRKAEERIN